MNGESYRLKQSRAASERASVSRSAAYRSGNRRNHPHVRAKTSPAAHVGLALPPNWPDFTPPRWQGIFSAVDIRAGDRTISSDCGSNITCADPTNLRIMHVEGDIVLVDIGRRSPTPGIFLLRDDVALVAKRLNYIPNSDLSVSLFRRISSRAWP